MSNTSGLRNRLGVETEGPVAAVGAGLALTVASVVGGLLATMLVWPIAGLLQVGDSTAVQILLNKGLQIGFFAVAIGYVVYRGAPERYARFQRPSLRDVGWLVAVFPLLKALEYIVEPVLAFLGVVVDSGGSEGVPELATQPELLPVAFVVWFLFAAPAEELLFRGVIQGRLRETFDVVPALSLAAGFFALMHVPWALLSSGMGPVSAVFAETFFGGLVFGLAYERTGNLVVPAVAHATIWASGILMYYGSLLTESVPL